jgi:hypothetical protein
MPKFVIKIDERDDGVYVVTELDGSHHDEAGPMSMNVAIAVAADVRSQAPPPGGTPTLNAISTTN